MRVHIPSDEAKSNEVRSVKSPTFERAYTQPPRPPLVVNVCHWCGAMWATYAGSLPRGWVKNTTGHLCCKRCRP